MPLIVVYISFLFEGVWVVAARSRVPYKWFRLCTGWLAVIFSLRRSFFRNVSARYLACLADILEVLANQKFFQVIVSRKGGRFIWEIFRRTCLGWGFGILGLMLTISCVLWVIRYFLDRFCLGVSASYSSFVSVGRYMGLGWLYILRLVAILEEVVIRKCF